MKQAVLITGHYYPSRRRAGFHWIADALAKAGWQVLFLTTALSWLSVLRRDYRLAYPVRREAGRVRKINDGISSFVWFTPYHPANLRLPVLNRVSSELFRNYGNLPLGSAEDLIAKSDLFVFESMSGLFLFKRFKKLSPQAKFVYRVSDYLKLLKAHPVVLAEEKKLLPHFDLVSVPYQYLYRLFDGKANVKLHLHGIEKDLFDRNCSNPYEKITEPNIVFVGASHIDSDFLNRASRLCPHCHFHMIGPIPNIPVRSNVTAYGELPFEQTIPYIKYADVGLQMLKYRPGIESITESLKVLQYTYCKLPIVAHSFIKCEYEHVQYYDPANDESIANAIVNALDYDRSKICTEDLKTWDELASQLVEED